MLVDLEQKKRQYEAWLRSIDESNKTEKKVNRKMFCALDIEIRPGMDDVAEMLEELKDGVYISFKGKSLRHYVYPRDYSAHCKLSPEGPTIKLSLNGSVESDYPNSVPTVPEEEFEPSFKASVNYEVPVQQATLKSARGVLLEAAEVLQSRGKERDQPNGERSMQKAVNIFNAIHPEIGLTEVQGWRFMQCLKLAREVQGSFREDDYLDGVGYAALKAECAIAENAHVENAGE